jgi:hypothetical protein
MRYVNAVADFVAQPRSLRHAIARFSVFVLLAALSIWLSHHAGSPVSIGWMFGYLWGALTVYGSLRPHLR